MKQNPVTVVKPPKVSVASKTNALDEQDRASSDTASKSMMDSSQLQDFKQLLGNSADGLSLETLGQVAHKEDIQKAMEMRLTPEEVEQAKAELQEAAVTEGRDPQSIDALVAVESLVAQSRSIEELLRNEPDFSAPDRNPSEMERAAQASQLDVSDYTEGPARGQEEGGPGSVDRPDRPLEPSGSSEGQRSAPEPDVDVEMELAMDMGGD